MIAQELWHTLAALLLEGLEKARHIPGIIPGVGHDIGAFEVGLCLGVAAEFEERYVGAEPTDGVDGIGQIGPSTGAGDCSEKSEPDFCDVGFGGLIRSMPQRHVTDLMRHDSGELPFSFGCGDSSEVDEDEAAGKGEGIDLFASDYIELVVEFLAGGLGGELRLQDHECSQRCARH